MCLNITKLFTQNPKNRICKIVCGSLFVCMQCLYYRNNFNCDQIRYAQFLDRIKINKHKTFQVHVDYRHHKHYLIIAMQTCDRKHAKIRQAH